MIKRIYVDMTADLFHYGHVNFLKQASEIGDYLIVGVHSDQTVENYKTPTNHYHEREGSFL